MEPPSPADLRAARVRYNRERRPWGGREPISITTVPQSIMDAVWRGRARGLDVRVESTAGYVGIDYITTPPHLRGQGLARETLADIGRAADVENKVLGITPSDFWGSDLARLTKLYSEAGFISNRGRSVHPVATETMVRLPSTQRDLFDAALP